MRLKSSNIIYVVALALMFLLINYYFLSLQKIYEVSTNFTSYLSNEVTERHDGIVTLTLMKFNRSIISTTTSTQIKENEIWLDFCNLTNIDPWDSTIMEFIQPQKDHMLGCKPKLFQHSKFIDGQLFIYSNQSMGDKINCQMRCIFSTRDWKIEFGNWSAIINGTKPECDVIEVECRLSDNNEEEESFYKYLHAQIYRNASKFPPTSIPKPPEKFDVHLIILDSVSRSQFIRSMPKTFYLLQEQYEAISFQHLNKVSQNSFPNAFALFLGKTYYSIPKSPFSRGYPSDFPDEYICYKSSLDEEQFIGFRYQDDGYVTMMAEDWIGALIDGCEGFHKSPMHHYMMPFHLRAQETIDERHKPLSKIIHEDSCREHHYNIMENVQQFLKAYPDIPKFSMSWMTHLTHDDQNALSSSDDYFYRFFKDTQKDFENSFLFVMGDHGLRFGEIRETKIGEMEDNNPALFLSVPKPLRNDPAFMNQLRKNSKELVTHYDIYATLNEIAQPKNPRILNPNLYGSSLLHPLPYPRTCDSLRIPFQYCNCHVQRTVLPKNNTIGIAAAKLMVEQMNLNLSVSNETATVCSKLSLDESAEIIVEDYGGEQNVRVYEIVISTIPGNGRFSSTVSFDPSNQKFEIISSKFSRLDRYENQAECAKKAFYESYCYCIDGPVLK